MSVGLKHNKEEGVKVYAWRESSEDFYYRVQVENILKRSLDKVIREVGEWVLHGDGFDPRSKRHILLFRRSFKRKRDFMSWAKDLPYEVHLQNRKGDYRIIK